LVVALVILGAIVSNNDNPTPASSQGVTLPPPTSSSGVSQPTVSEQHTPSLDLTNAQQLDEKYGVDATVYCSSDADEYLRSVAKYDFKWDDIGFLENKFDKYLKHVAEPGVLVMVSEKAKLQDGFGAYQHVKLLCSYDTQSQKVQSYWIDEN
jgi:hypothetical protein